VDPCQISTFDSDTTIADLTYTILEDDAEIFDIPTFTQDPLCEWEVSYEFEIYNDLSPSTLLAIGSQSTSLTDFVTLDLA
jgi:hypothetical protein